MWPSDDQGVSVPCVLGQGMGKMGEVETGEPACNANSTTSLSSPGLFPPL